MALDKSGLQSDIEEITGPDTKADAAAAWAGAMQTHAADIVPPSTAVDAATTALATALLPAMSTTNVADTAPIWESAFLAFATTVGVGMLPTFSSTPPPDPVGFSELFADDRDDLPEAAADLADAIDDWMKTGIATLVAPPNTPQNWA